MKCATSVNISVAHSVRRGRWVVGGSIPDRAKQKTLKATLLMFLWTRTLNMLKTGHMSATPIYMYIDPFS